jgi:RNA polymerase sigma-70 factor (ECF subfamily)
MDADGDVWDLLCKGERAQALQLLMQRYGRDVHRFCHKLLGDETLADDVHQQVFLSAYHDLPHFAGRSTMRTWLLSIARHRSIDALRCRARQESRQADLAEVAGISDPRPLAIESLGRTQLLTTALDSLEEPARQALLLRYQRGLSFEEMARICDQRPAVLRMRVSRALRRLREAMQACAKRFSAPALHQRKLGTTSARCSAAVDAAMPIAAVA